MRVYGHRGNVVGKVVASKLRDDETRWHLESRNRLGGGRQRQCKKRKAGESAWHGGLLEQGLNVRLGIKRGQVVELFADAHELDRQAELLFDAENRTAFGRAVELRQY